MCSAFHSTRVSSGFCTALAADMGVDPSSVEIRTPSGAAMSLTMSHNFAWKPGRRMAVGEQLFVVSIVTVDDGELDNFSPSVSGRRPNVRLAQAPAVGGVQGVRRHRQRLPRRLGRRRVRLRARGTVVRRRLAS